MQNSYHLIDDLVRELRSLQIREEERLRCTHGRFNVFTTVLAAHDEVRLHTRFIHLLLSPSGNHDCGDQFLNLFWEALADIGTEDDKGGTFGFPWQELRSEGPWVVLKESSQPTCTGQMDILLESDESVIVIENKIHAAEQRQQLSRYANYCKSKPEKRAAILYLTLDGKRAHSHGGHPYARISYNLHIREWLEACLRCTYSIIPINQILLQYRAVVDQLTGKTSTEATMNAVVEYLKEHPETIGCIADLNSGINALRNETLDDFIASLQRELDADFHTELRSDMRGGRFSADPFGDLIISRRSGDLSSSHSFEIWVEYISKWDGLVIGIENRWRKKTLENSRESELLEEMNNLLNELCMERGWHKANPQQTFGGTYWPVGWHNIFHPFLREDKHLASLQNPATKEEWVSKAGEEIRSHLSLLDECYHVAASKF